MRNNEYINLEEKLLGICLTDIKVLSENIDKISEKLFSKIEYKTIWHFIEVCYSNFGVLLSEDLLESIAKEEGRSVDEIEKYKTVYTYLLSSASSPEYTKYLIDELKKLSLFREIISKVDNSLNEFNKGMLSKALDTLVSGVLSLFESYDLPLNRGEYIETFPERKKELEERISNPEKSWGILTGISELDKITRGLFPGELGMIMGRTSIGKSMLALHFARNAFCNGKKVLYIVEEMPLKQVFMRLDAAFVGVEYFKFKSGSILPFEKDRWEVRMNELSKLSEMGARLYIVHIPVGCTLEVIKREIEYIKLCKKEEIDLLIVDDLDMMEYPKQLSEEQGQARNARGLKGIAGEYQIPVWFTTQITTDAYKKEFLESQDVGWSRRKVHVADFVIGLIQSEADKDAGTLTLQIVKFRDGEVNKKIQLTPDLSKCIIHMETMFKPENFRSEG